MNIFLKLFTILIFIQGHNSFSQRSITEYFSKNWKPVKEKKAHFIRNIEFLNDTSSIISEYTRNKQLLMRGEFYALDTLVPNGVVEFYDEESGNIKMLGSYHRGEMIGIWRLYKNDTLKMINYDSPKIVKLCYEKEYVGYKIPDFRGMDPSISFRKYIMEELIYPPYEALHSIEDRIIIQFLINSSGEICDPIVMSSTNKNFIKEAMRVISNSPNWSTLNEGCTRFTFPVWFKLN